jgi:hypothetical protein
MSFFYNRKLLKRCQIREDGNVAEENYPPLVRQRVTERPKVQFDKETVKAEILAIIEAFHGRKRKHIAN